MAAVQEKKSANPLFSMLNDTQESKFEDLLDQETKPAGKGFSVANYMSKGQKKGKGKKIRV